MAILTPMQIDALNELGNIGSSHAANALSALLMHQIELTVPAVEIVDLAEVHEYVTDDPFAIILFEMQGEIDHAGYILFLLPLSSAIRMINVMMGMDDENREIGEMDESALQEIGNIMASAFLNATAELLSVIMMPSPPNLVIDMGHAVIEEILTDLAVEVNEVIIFQTSLSCDQYSISGNLMMLPAIDTLREILSIMDQMLEDSA
ncbi:MAG: chemotaxis protein CheC [Methanocalculus sp. MSAO_Arc1]|uniref:chemotaxis protein CheC n=1 Tax=Methanocalculus TaxID=71151 RepID=UPI000FF3ECA6|nr:MULTISPECIES: chemotaxis protein CheC [unclassified Methanocalculus]MCP1661398.1 chemotaxis protein CheC [Methanocalculus sp. AMF5]RQD79704.1 MAG: chemotaxis protein CheC [Methanocalculus sp. MSAO_Arc1]